MQYAKEIVKFGPRPLGSANHKKVEDYIYSHLKGDRWRTTPSPPTRPEGKFPVRNIIAKYPGTKDGIIVIASHYDTNYPLRNTSFIGANDGAATSALLLEFANQIRGKKREGYSVWLLWTDAEEAMKTSDPIRRQPLWHQTSRAEVAGRRNRETDQSIPAGRHDWRRRSRH